VGAVVVHPGAAYGSCRWPADRFAAVVRHLVAEHVPVVLTGSAAERPLALRVAAASGLPGESVLAGETDLLQLAALVAEARLVLCGDTGVAHLATAYGRPSVLLFGPTPPSRWGPRTQGRHTVLWQESPGADPFGCDPAPGLLRISVEEVLAAVCRRLRTGVDWSS
jgi:ADP-heptose:LPS heptosyltransferase